MWSIMRILEQHVSSTFFSIFAESLPTTLSGWKALRTTQYIICVDVYVILWFCLHACMIYVLSYMGSKSLDTQDWYALGGWLKPDTSICCCFWLIQTRGLIQTWHGYVRLYDMYVVCCNLGSSLSFMRIEMGRIWWYNILPTWFRHLIYLYCYVLENCNEWWLLIEPMNGN